MMQQISVKSFLFLPDTNQQLLQTLYCIRAAAQKEKLGLKTVWSHATTENRSTYVQLKKNKFFFQNSRGSVPPVFRLSSSLLSSADLSQPVVCLGVGDDGLNGHDGLVDLGLELSQLLDVQQAQDLSCLIQSRIWEDICFRHPSQSNIFWCLLILFKLQDPIINGHIL